MSKNNNKIIIIQKITTFGVGPSIHNDTATQIDIVTEVIDYLSKLFHFSDSNFAMDVSTTAIKKKECTKTELKLFRKLVQKNSTDFFFGVLHFCYYSSSTE